MKRYEDIFHASCLSKNYFANGYSYLKIINIHTKELIYWEKIEYKNGSDRISEISISSDERFIAIMTFSAKLSIYAIEGSSLKLVFFNNFKGNTSEGYIFKFVDSDNFFLFSFYASENKYCLGKLDIQTFKYLLTISQTFIIDISLNNKWTNFIYKSDVDFYSPKRSLTKIINEPFQLEKVIDIDFDNNIINIYDDGKKIFIESNKIIMSDLKNESIEILLELNEGVKIFGAVYNGDKESIIYLTSLDDSTIKKESSTIVYDVDYKSYIEKDNIIVYKKTKLTKKTEAYEFLIKERKARFLGYIYEDNYSPSIYAFSNNFLVVSIGSIEFDLELINLIKIE
jgi:hypothetical protein